MRSTITGRRRPTSSRVNHHGDRPPYEAESATIGGPTTAPPPGRRRRSTVWTRPRVGRLFRRRRRPSGACRRVDSAPPSMTVSSMRC